jgi:hypothetical protein
MIKDTFDDFFNKIRSPFFGTFIVIWFFWNYDIFVAIYDLDLYPTTDGKIARIKHYIHNNYWHLTAVPFALSLVSLIVYYTGLAGGLIVKEFYTLKLKPGILHWLKPYAKTTSNDVVNRLDKTITTLRERNGILLLNISTAENERKNAEIQLTKANEKIGELDGTLKTVRQSQQEALQQSKGLSERLTTISDLLTTVNEFYVNAKLHHLDLIYAMVKKGSVPTPEVDPKEVFEEGEYVIYMEKNNGALSANYHKFHEGEFADIKFKYFHHNEDESMILFEFDFDNGVYKGYKHYLIQAINPLDKTIYWIGRFETSNRTGRICFALKGTKKEWLDEFMENM